MSIEIIATNSKLSDVKRFYHNFESTLETKPIFTTDMVEHERKENRLLAYFSTHIDEHRAVDGLSYTYEFQELLLELRR